MFNYEILTRFFTVRYMQDLFTVRYVQETTAKWFLNCQAESKLVSGNQLNSFRVIKMAVGKGDIKYNLRLFRVRSIYIGTSDV